MRPVYFEQVGWVDTPIYDRESMPTGHLLSGPAIIEEKAAVTLIEQGQTIHADIYGNLIIDTGVLVDEQL